jgi:predicted secreted protein
VILVENFQSVIQNQYPIDSINQTNCYLWFSDLLLQSNVLPPKPHTMTKSYFVLFFLMVMMVLPVGVHAQSSVHTSWGEGTGSGGRMTYSVGQVFIQSVSVPGVARMSEGVQQPLEVLTIGMEDVSQILEGIKLFPNPTAGELHLQIRDFVPGAFSYRLLNNLGQCIQEGEVQSSSSLLSLESVSAGSYRIEVRNTGGNRRVFQVIKRN